jgi:hypothetical protein
MNEIKKLALTIKEHFEILGYDIEINDLGDSCNVKVIDDSWKPSLTVDVCITTLEGGITFVTVLCGYEPATEFRGPLDTSDIEDITKTIFEHLV